MKLEPTNVTLTGLGKSSVKPLGYFRAENEINDLKLIIDTYVINESSICFDLIFGTDIIHQGTLTISGIEVRMYKIDTEHSNFLVNIVNVLDESETDLNRFGY